MNTHLARALAVLAALGTMTAGAYAGMAIGNADSVTVELPRCLTEDCSDLPPGTLGAWIDPDTGDAYLARN